MGTSKPPTGLFLRYCAACNSAAPSVAARGKCAECGTALNIVDAGPLIEALGYKLDVGQREAARASVQAHDLPRT